MRQIFVNLPVKDLERSKKFFQGLGFSIDPNFSDEKAACVVLEKDQIHVMLLTEPFFKTFTPRALADARKSTEVLVCLSCASDQEVKDLVAKASRAGGKPVREAQDHGFMYQHGFEDLDGHIWELVHMRSQPQ
jgi:predicted lactoylglutathione lyase